jgi:hypothetical protein
MIAGRVEAGDEQLLIGLPGLNCGDDRAAMA